jgi:prepilin-type N-terminal cleavage/methylation domain-containing protein
MIKKIYTIKKGFSLIETLIAVSILMIAVSGPLALVQAGLFSSIHQRNQVIATYLAQEAIEYIKNIRFTNSYNYYAGIQGNDWMESPDGGSLLAICEQNDNRDDGCFVDIYGKLTGDKHFVRFEQGDPKKFLNKIDKGSAIIYSYEDDGEPTTYNRIVKIKEISSDEAVVSVTISWKDAGLERSYTVNTNIYNYAIGDAD